MKKLGAIILTGLLWGSFPAVAAYADHDDNGCWDGECYDGGGDGYSQDYDQNYGSRDDRNRNRRRNRGAFSPGPFDKSPVTICMPYACNSGGEQSGGNRNDDGRNDNPPEET